MKITIEDILAAGKLLENSIKKTEIDYSQSASKRLGGEIYFKQENQQYTGSFKIRGATNKLSSLSPEEKKKGIVANSAGNHAQGVALAAQRLGIDALIVMPETSPLVKISATEGYGARVVLKGKDFEEAYQHAREIEKSEGRIYIHPYEDPAIIAGQGTIGSEIYAEIPDLDTLVVPIGGGGLISGIATYVKEKNPKCRIYGVQSECAPGVAQHYVEKEEALVKQLTIADGIAVKTPTPVMYQNFISRLVDDVVTVSDDDIAQAMVFLLERTKLVVEGAGAAGFAAAITDKIKLGAKNCFVLSGGNIDLNIISKVINQGLSRYGRLVQLSVVVDDSPGNLSRLTAAIAAEGANVLQVSHGRFSSGLQLRQTRIHFILETTSLSHVDRIEKALAKVGGQVIRS